MSLLDTMASDWAPLLADLGQSVTVQPIDLVASFTITGMFGDQNDRYVADKLGTDQGTVAQFFCPRSAWLAGRDPMRGDKLTVASGNAYTGDWYVQLVSADQGDGLALTVIRAEQYQVGGEGVATVAN